MNKSAVWSDITSYGQGDTERNPRVLLCRLTANISFKVHKHILWGDAWLLSCEYLELDNRDLETVDINEAKEKAIEVIIKKLKETRVEIDSALSVLCDNQAAVQKQ